MTTTHTDEQDLRAEALRILEACDPGDCGCGQPHSLVEGSEDIVEQMVELIRPARG